MNLLLLLTSSTITLLIDLASAQQQLIPSNLPPCAQQCANLFQAQTGCVPPAAPVTNTGTYTSCFCQSTFTAQLKAGSAPQFCPTCSPGDMTTIQSWFTNLCNAGGSNGQVTQAPNGQSTTTPATTLITATASLSTAPASTNSGVTLSGSQVNNEPNAEQGGWMSTHWRWVLMLIILALGLSGIAYGGWWLRRRYHRKREGEEAGPRPDLGVWGPGRNSAHNVQDFAGTSGPGDKGKAREMVETQQAAPPASVENASSGRRLKSLRKK